MTKYTWCVNSCAGPKRLLSYISSLFCKKWTVHKISVLQEKQEGGFILYVTNALRGMVFPTCLGHSWRWSFHLFAYHGGPLIEWFTTPNSVELKVTHSPCLKTWVFSRKLFQVSTLWSILQHWLLFGRLNLLKSQRIIIGCWCILLSKLTMLQIQ